LADSLHKWILFSTMARRKRGTLYLVVEEGKKAGFKEWLDNKQIAAELIAI